MPTIAKRITKARQALGLNQKELAIKAQITESTLSRFERGTREPRTDALSRLSKVLEVSPNYLIFGLKDDGNFNNESIIDESLEDIISDFSIKIKKCIETNNLSYKTTTLYQEQLEAILTNLNLEFLRAKLECEKNKF
ncbi:MAG: helix-turn-helix transcriptional regulator [Romboutsia timonensis]|uniref:helix-turn-helix domain-containing protein n=1 Tax=Romboutsia timonensis TaxID=1776391 RepID=UPI002A7623E7|nr:helix-turn-helix transcriptional regulator [Romboutsia timonensis]MDY3002357.1 helix-turn-helix transcriptional regulator [Romboutsia timonensis]